MKMEVPVTAPVDGVLRHAIASGADVAARGTLGEVMGA